MKHRILIPSLALIVSASLSAQTTVLELRFNDPTTSTTAANSGSLGSALDGTLEDDIGTVQLGSTTGVSGLVGDRAFDNTQTVGHEGADSARVSVGNLGNIPTHESFTISFWQRHNSPAATSGTRFISDFGNFVVVEPGGGVDAGIRVADGTDAIVSGNGALDTSEWQFIAFTVDGTGTTDNFKLFTGTETSAVQEIVSGSISASSFSPSGTMAIGNQILNFNSGFDGLIDNVLITISETGSAGALSLSDLESQRQFDVSTIPEPSSFALLGGSLAFALLSRRRRRR